MMGVKLDNPSFRYDSEYFDKKHIALVNSINLAHTEKMSELASWVTQGPNPVFSSTGAVPCLTGRNIANGRVNYSGADYVEEAEYSKLVRFQLEVGDTLITLKGKGSIGKIGYVTEKRKAIFSRNIGIIRPKHIDSAAYLNAFIMSKYGQKLVLRGETGGTGQTTLTTAHLKSLDVPIFSSLSTEISRILDKSELLSQSASEKYITTENFLLSFLGMMNATLSQDSFAEKSLKKSFMMSGRLDAEYYQEKYEVLETLLNGETHKFTIHDSNFDPRSDIEYRYIELSNIGSTGNITGATIDIGAELPTRARRKVEAGQVIVSSIEGSLSSCALITDEYDGALCSTGFYVVDSKNYNPETLLVLFKSLPIQALLKKRCSGTILTGINKDEMKSLPLPTVDADTQAAIATNVRNSFDLRHKSEQLLEQAKLAVEMAIEQGEEAAMSWLKERGVEA